ncbi:MAG: energy transducer TonB [Runella slithyformis]|nr:MAG: energy transducer TonB [Runella slithyformis]
MKNLILTFFFFFCISMAQNHSFRAQLQPFFADSVGALPIVRQSRPPLFSGGEEAFQAFVIQNAHFPERAYREGLEGTVYVEVYVLPTGKLQLISVKGRVGGGCEEEAVRVVSLMPSWLPALRESEPMRCKVRIPITFKWH